MATKREPTEVWIDWDGLLAEYNVDNATFSDKLTKEDLEKYIAIKYTAFLMRSRKPGVLFGGSGYGKTQTAQAMARHVYLGDRKARPWFQNMATASIDNWKIAFPSMDPVSKEEYLIYLVDEVLSGDDPIIGIFDEIGQADREMNSGLMQLFYGGRFGGRELAERLITVVCTDNPNTDLYGGLETLELAQASRLGRTDPLGFGDIPWERALAVKYAETDLKTVLNTYKNFRLDAVSREIANPRVLDQGVLRNLLAGLPGEAGIPWQGEERYVLRNPQGEDVTRKFVEAIAGALGVHAPLLEDVDNILEKTTALSLKDGSWNMLAGDPGVGKTTSVIAEVTKQRPDAQLVLISLAESVKEDVVINVPSGNEDGIMRQLTFDFLMNDKPKYIILDEFNRGVDARMARVMSELVQEGTVNGYKVKNLLGGTAIINPPFCAGEPLDTRDLTLPQASRFAFSYRVTPKETKAFDWLVATYPDPMPIFVEWRREAFKPGDPRVAAANPRVLESLYLHYTEGVPMRFAVPFTTERLDLPLSDLEIMLAAQPLAVLSVVAKKIDEFEIKLAKRDANNEMVHPEMHLAAYKACVYAHLPELQRHRDVCVRVIRKLSTEYRFKLLTHEDASIQDFWHDTFEEACPATEA